MPNRLLPYLLIIILLVTFCPGAGSQDGSAANNPFELPDRLPPEEKVEKPDAELAEQPDGKEEKEEEKLPENPFELPENQLKPEKGSAETGENGTPDDKEIIPWTPEIPDFGEGKVISDFWIGMYILLLGVILAVLNTLFINDVRKIIRAFVSMNMLNLSYRQLGERISNYAVLLHLFYLLSGSLFLFLIVNHFNFAGLGYNITTFVLAFGFLLLVTFLRHLLLIGVGVVFPFGKEISLYRYTINIFDYITGFILFPLAVIIAFAPAEISRGAVIISIGLILLIYLFRSLRGLTIGRKFLSLHKFHFFLYLCTVEIAPLAVIVKLLTIWGSAV